MKRILIVDDAATMRMYFRNILEGAGYLVNEAVNGIEAMEKSLQEPFDLYIVDVNMPNPSLPKKNREIVKPGGFRRLWSLLILRS